MHACVRFSSFQRAHIPQSIMDVLLGNKRPHLEEYDVKMEAVSIKSCNQYSLILLHQNNTDFLNLH